MTSTTALALRVACGAALGTSVALVVGAGPVVAVVTVVVTAVLTWALRGLPRLAAATALSLAATSLVVVALSHLPTRPAIPSALVGGLWLAGVAVLAAVSRRPRWASREGSAAVDVLAAASALGWAVWFAGRAPAGGRDAVLLLVGSDDNAAWVDAAARGLLGGTPALAPETVGSYGPVLSTVLGVVATAGDGAAVAVVRTYGLLVIGALLAAALLVRRVSGADAAARAGVAWAAVVVVVVAADLYLGTRFGFLSAVLLVVLVLIAASFVAATRPRPDAGAELVARTAAAAVVWAAASSWVGAVPAGALALALMAIPLVRGGRGPASWRVGALSVLVLLEAGLVLHWLRVAPGAGGASGLIGASGDVPSVDAVALLLAAASVGAACVVDRVGSRLGGLARSALLVGGYAAVVVAASWVRTGGSGYAAQKTLFLATVICTAVGVAAVAHAPRPAARPLTATAAAAAVVVVVTALAGPTLVTSVVTAWPRPVPPPGWLDAGLAASRPSMSVGCLPDPSAPVDGRGSDLDAYWCTRWLSSLAGADGAEALRWRAALLGAVPTSAAVADLGAPGGPATVVVLGPGGLERLGPDAEGLLADRGVLVVRL